MVIGIIGGGASGMMAALSACRNTENRVVLFERQSRLGRKLMATGNGRCNLSNTNASVGHYHGRDPEFVVPCLERFGVEETLAFFRTLGLVTVTEPDGRIYPFSDQANSVSDVLRLALEAGPVELRLGCEIRELRREDGGFNVTFDGGEQRLDRVIVAAGGMAGRQLGGSDMGYELLKSLGHRCTSSAPIPPGCAPARASAPRPRPRCIRATGCWPGKPARSSSPISASAAPASSPWPAPAPGGGGCWRSSWTCVPA